MMKELKNVTEAQVLEFARGNVENDYNLNTYFNEIVMTEILENGLNTYEFEFDGSAFEIERLDSILIDEEFEEFESRFNVLVNRFELTAENFDATMEEYKAWREDCEQMIADGMDGTTEAGEGTTLKDFSEYASLGNTISLKDMLELENAYDKNFPNSLKETILRVKCEKLEGMKWNDISEEDQEELLENYSTTEKTGDTIVDFNKYLSINAYIDTNEFEDEAVLKIDPEAILYNPNN